ncbi:hypothetical protein [Halosegnis longus]|uniref:hypothetical protein n=1 Tax=Halosegnis longus TaxID=2216012 RepID=UPI00117C6680|nr:hypothetical protein [Salella cibi]
MSNSNRRQPLLARLREPHIALGTIGWLFTAIPLLLVAPLIGGVTLLLALPLWLRDVPAGGFAIAQVGIATAIGDGSLLAIAVLEIGPSLLIIALLVERGLSPRMITGTAMLTGLLVPVAIGAFSIWESVGIAGITLLGTAALASYFLHRYELLTLDLLQ